MPRTRVVIQSRLNSSRLPGKAMLTIAGMPLIELVARRASRGGHEVVVATSEEQYDERIAAHLSTVRIPVVRGSLDDVLGRFVQATADLAPEDRVVRLTGDNPVADADLVDELLAALESSDHTYGRVDIDQVPEGLGAEAFSVAALREADSSATAAYDREHVTPWLRRTLGELLFVPQGCPDDVHAYRATVDTLGDYVRVSSLFDDVADPVGRPWLEFMNDLASSVDAAGPQIPSAMSAAGRLSRVVLSAQAFDGDDPAHDSSKPAERAERLRGLLAGAIERGVTHVDVGRADGRSEELLRSSAEPALVKRFGLICRLWAPALEDDACPEAYGVAVEASVERSFANLGRRGVDALVFPDAVTAARGWERAQRYRAEGLARSLGLVARSVADLEWAAQSPDVGYVEVGTPDDAATSDLIAELATRGCVLVVRQATAVTDRAVPSWAAAVLVTALDTTAFDRAAAAVDS
ncbi:cytidylyltransferase domain-containing protein [Terrabacter sp. Ter38]|uniref:cytidylyltransferase domain-containing protein n=1 Tax=Terrabacter sp. Ter38 TaxID=2926030 RepID=UPI0021184089|nr:NTP transferase domain-containing protein [Terrabacter sp. Ter38]